MYFSTFRETFFLPRQFYKVRLYNIPNIDENTSRQILHEDIRMK